MRTRALSALLAGLLFGCGLALSGMVNPAKVLGFLDIGGDWDPSLAGVMAAAIPVTALMYRLAVRRGRTLLGGALPGPATGGVDTRLLAGAAIFGLGWGLAGLCPGPAIADLALQPGVLLFVVAMAIGMRVADRWLPRKS
ncbi:MAG: YeeE/YedE family protein [Telmatospirillum sp.]|nr:YeeE/YedE family protein [Telmatospirillum sp.]